MYSVDWLRPLGPVAYNPTRKCEQPIPRAEFTIDAVGIDPVEENDDEHDSLDSTFF